QKAEAARLDRDPSARGHRRSSRRWPARRSGPLRAPEREGAVREPRARPVDRAVQRRPVASSQIKKRGRTLLLPSGAENGVRPLFCPRSIGWRDPRRHLPVQARRSPLFAPERINSRRYVPTSEHWLDASIVVGDFGRRKYRIGIARSAAMTECLALAQRRKR